MSESRISLAPTKQKKGLRKPLRRLAMVKSMVLITRRGQDDGLFAASPMNLGSQDVGLIAPVTPEEVEAAVKRFERDTTRVRSRGWCSPGGYDPRCCRWPKSCSSVGLDDGLRAEMQRTDTIKLSGRLTVRRNTQDEAEAEAVAAIKAYVGDRPVNITLESHGQSVSNAQGEILLRHWSMNAEWECP